MTIARAQKDVIAIQRLFRGHLERRRQRTKSSNMTDMSTVSATKQTISFILNPYNANLNLDNKDDHKLFAEATKELCERQKFDRKKKSFPDFAKLVGHLLGYFRLEENLRVAVKWSNATN
eukprot:13565457-Ditylum_brightwellii.AAC.1